MKPFPRDGGRAGMGVVGGCDLSGLEPNTQTVGGGGFTPTPALPHQGGGRQK
jgi:hypothetical protein